MTTERHGNPTQRRAECDGDSERDRLEKALQIGLEDTFPASDAVAVVQPAPTARLSAQTPGRRTPATVLYGNTLETPRIARGRQAKRLADGHRHQPVRQATAG